MTFTSHNKSYTSLCDHALLLSVCALAGILFSTKIYLGLSSGLVWDEAHFWVSGRHPAWGYSDVPAGWPLLIALGAALFGDTLFGVRFFALLLSAGLVFGIFVLARTVTTYRNALWAAAGALLLPLAGLQGIIAFPEIAIEFCTVWTLVFAVRALQDKQLSHWALAGLVCGLGVFFHYRFALLPLALFAFLLIPQNRSLWRDKGLWLAGALAFLGLLPTLLHNILNDFAPFYYHLISRHDWTFDPVGLAHILKQALVVTPFFFAALLGAFFIGLKKSKNGNQSAGLIVFCCGFIFCLYTLLAPFTYDPLVHWSFAAYPPLLVFMPEALRQFILRGQSWRKSAMFLVPVSGGLIALIVMFFLAASTNPSLLPNPLWARHLQGDFEDWSAVGKKIDEVLAQEFPGQSDIPVIAGHHRLSALVQFSRRSKAKAYTLWHPQDDQASFSAMRRAWGEDEEALRLLPPGQRVLVVQEVPKRLTLSEENVSLYFRRCALFTNVNLVGEQETSLTTRNVQIFVATLAPYKKIDKPLPLPTIAEKPACLFLPHFFLFHPHRGQTISGLYTVSGWAAWPNNIDSGIDHVELLIDGKLVTNMVHNIRVVGHEEYDAFAQGAIPPKVGIWGRLDTTGWENGLHRLGLRIHTNDGNFIDAEERTIYIVND